MAGVIPGVMLGVMFALYIILRCSLNPNLAPPYEVERAHFAVAMTAS